MQPPRDSAPKPMNPGGDGPMVDSGGPTTACPPRDSCPNEPGVDIVRSTQAPQKPHTKLLIPAFVFLALLLGCSAAGQYVRTTGACAEQRDGCEARCARLGDLHPGRESRTAQHGNQRQPRQ